MVSCFHCGKTAIFGRSHTHHRGVAGGRWKKRAPKTPRLFKVNLQPVMAMLDKGKKRIKLCTKCIKRIKKDIRDGKRPFVQLVDHKTPKSKSKLQVKSKAQNSKPKK